MRTTLLLAAGLALTAPLAAFAQQDAGAGQDSGARGGAGIRSNNITSTGETVPNPGASQSAGTTSLDRGIQDRDNKIDSSICKGC